MYDLGINSIGETGKLIVQPMQTTTTASVLEK
jgi:hypothetical protein